jgi:hypothetical protein
MTRRINLWSGPRNVSTALMYSFANRTDTHAVDEPLYGHYLKISESPHPGADKVMAAMDCDGERVVREVMLANYDKPIVFFKQMAHHLVGLDWDFFEQTDHIILTRNPQEVIPSLTKNIPNQALSDTGFARQVEILNHVRKLGKTIPVIESKQLLLDPHRVLNQLCDQLNMPFDTAMLSWPAGPKSADGVWAKYWYHNVHKSTGFQPYREKTEPFPDHLKPLLEECLPYYEQLFKHAIKAES